MAGYYFIIFFKTLSFATDSILVKFNFFHIIQPAHYKLETPKVKLIILYGPPGVGKLTIARLLAEATGLDLVHNHLVSDLVLSVFRRNTQSAISLSANIKNLILKTAAQERKKGIIMTFLYDSGKKNQINGWCNDCAKIMHEYGGEIFLVRLSCEIETLKLRVADPSRLETKKITSPEKLLTVIKNEGSFGEVSKDIVESLHIDNTHISPEEATDAIRSHCGLQ